MPTAYEIYQTYLKGPAALIRLFEQALGTAAIYGSPPTDLQQRTIESQAQEIDRLKSQIARLQAELSELRHHNFRLSRRNSELEAIISRDSHNSSRPPSSDQPWAKRTKSLRRLSGKLPGGQQGHTGHTRPLTARPTRVVVHRPMRCRRCHATLDVSEHSRYKRRQIIDIIPARLRVTEHRAEVVRCAACGTTTSGEFPKQVRAPSSTVHRSARERSICMTISSCLISAPVRRCEICSAARCRLQLLPISSESAPTP